MSTIRPSLRPATVALHGGQTPDRATGARAVPIYQTSSYVFESADHAAALFALQQPGHIYTRIGNPTTEVLERRLARARRRRRRAGAGLRAGGHHGGRAHAGEAGRQHRLDALPLRRHLQPLPLHAGAPGHRDALRRHVRPAQRGAPPSTRTRGSSTPSRSATRGTTSTTSRRWPTSPTPPACRSSSTTPCRPYIFRPFDHGADIIVYSLTKFIGGHGTSIGGAIVDSGRFNWANGRFPEFTEPDPSYHGLVFWDLFGTARAGGGARRRVHHEGARRSCCATSARASRRSTRSCSCRASRRCRTGSPRTARTRAKVAAWLAAHPGGGMGELPGPAGPPRPRPRRALPRRRRRRDRRLRHQGRPRGGARVHRRVRLFSHLANIGDAKSLVIHPGVDHAPAAVVGGAARPPACPTTSSACRSGIEDVDDIDRRPRPGDHGGARGRRRRRRWRARPGDGWTVETQYAPVCRGRPRPRLRPAARRPSRSRTSATAA